MSTFIGHALAGAGLAAAGLGRARSSALRHPVAWVAGALLGILPDFDLVVFRFLGLDWAPTGHRGPSHTLGAALVGGAGFALCGALCRLGWRDALRMGRVAGGIVSLHALMDAACGTGRGVALAWPFSTTGFLSPIPLLPSVQWSRAVPDLVELFGTAHNLSVLTAEVLIFGPPACAAMAWAWRGRVPPTPVPVPA